MLEQMKRTQEEIKSDTPCIGVCTLNEDKVCIGCNRHIDEIITVGLTHNENWNDTSG